MTDLRIGDPVMDAAQGRPMVVVETPAETVAEWIETNDYDLLSNYANAKFDPGLDEPVVECVYVSDVRSEPSKTYTFPRSRVRLLDVHHADDGPRIYDRVVRDVLEQLFDVALGRPDESADILHDLAQDALDEWEVIDLARTLAHVEHLEAPPDVEE